MRRAALLVAIVTLVLSAGIVPGRAANPPVISGGIYYVDPSLETSGGTVTRLGGGSYAAEIFGQGFDLSPRKLVWTNSDTAVTVVSASGAVDVLNIDGLYAIARPTLSPSGTEIAVQATETPVGHDQAPTFLTIYVIDLTNGSWYRLAPIPDDPVPGNELPDWLATGNRIAYWAVEDNCQVIRIVDATTGAMETTIRDDGPTGCFNPDMTSGPRFHTASSADGKSLFIPGHMQIYDVDSAALLADLRAEALAGLAAAGYEPDDRFPGQGNAGTFPLDGDISPTGSHVIFDGAVHHLDDDTFGVLLMRMKIDGTGFEILEGPLTVDPAFSNNHNFSQLTPMWLPNYRPDAQIKAGASYVGNNVYNLTGKSQTAAGKAAGGSSKTFFVKIQNDGDVTDTFSVTGAGGPRGFTVKYMAGTKVITGDVLNGYTVTLGPGRTKTIKLVFGVKSSTARGAIAIVPVQITTRAAGSKDVVKARLTAT